MPPAVLPNLIIGQDNFEIVRDQIAAIITLNQANQVALATTAGQPNPDDWKMRVFTERSNAWEQFLNIDVNDATADLSPIINIWHDSTQYPENFGDPVKQQRSDTVYNIDIIGFGVSESDGGVGQLPGDQQAAFNNQRAIRFIRNILMSPQNINLQLRPTVGNRWIQSINSFQPQLDSTQIQQILGSRIAFRVAFNEFGQQYTGQTLEEIRIDVIRAEDGQIVLQQQFNYPLP